MLTSRKNRTKLVSDNDTPESYPLINVEILVDDPASTLQERIYVQDINDSGMGVTCEFKLKVGQKIKFIEDQLEWDLPDEGVVMWTFKTSDGFQAGIKFM